MKTLTNLLTRISRQLELLTDSVNQINQQTASQKKDLERTRQEMVRTTQDTTWDVNMLRQEMATKQNLRHLGGQLASRQDLSRALEVLGDKLAGLRFDSHREHQELLRYMDEGPYGLVGMTATPPASTEPTRWQEPTAETGERTRPSERSATLSMDEVLELEDVQGVVEHSGARREASAGVQAEHAACPPRITAAA